ncbi:MAG: hypothetical protein DRO40_08960 [Thermoprotei archaeon]|nr:MAG: hypothetical protein DRO40_08960 [Thermoprotei archaeon]
MADLGFIGIGRVGRLALELVSREYKNLDIIAIDCKDLSRDIGKINPNIKFYRTCDPGESVDLLHGTPVVATALPSRIAKRYIERLLNNGLNVVDVSFIDFNPYDLENLCINKRAYYIVDAGFAPGFTNLVVGKIYHELGELDHVKIYVGGIPVEPVPPVGYQITWSAEDLIEEYIRPARIITDGKIMAVDPLKEIVNVEIPQFGSYEGFYSDGLRTLLRNVRAKDMFEVSIRYKGHLEAMKTLRELGFFSKEEIEVIDTKIEPYRFTARLFEKVLKQTIPDIAILYIDIAKDKYYYKLLSSLVGSLEKSALALYTALVYAKTIMLALEKDFDYAVHPLEDLYRYFNDYVAYLSKHNVVFDIKTNIT